MNQPNILVVDHFLPVRTRLVEHLRHEGFRRIVELGDSFAALQLLHKFGPRNSINIIIADLHLPKLNGLQLLRSSHLDPHLRGIPFLLLLGEHDRRSLPDLFHSGIWDYIIKPFNDEKLHQTLGELKHSTMAQAS